MDNHQWFKEAGYGMMVHWGLYSLLAGEYKGRIVRPYAEWSQSFYRIPNEEYGKLAKAFNPVFFNADEWVRLAKECGMNRTYLCKLFVDETGMTVGKYVTHTKMEEAKRLMDITPKSTAEIAEYLGYSSQSHFQRVFKQYTGLTPGGYRSSSVNK